jgi:hypothetical protein
MLQPVWHPRLFLDTERLRDLELITRFFLDLLRLMVLFLDLDFDLTDFFFDLLRVSLAFY